MMIVAPIRVSVASSRGSGASNLGTLDPKEAWVDDADANVGAVTFTVDLGSVQLIDTIFLGYARSASAAATWAIRAGIGSADTVVQPATALRVPDVAGQFAETSHALFHGAPRATRWIELTVSQPAGSSRLSVGVLVIGRAFVPALGREWGAGRKPIDTGSATPLPSGGFAIVEGTRKRQLTWTFGDLTGAEADALEAIALALGDTSPAVVIEDAAHTAGLRARIHYGLFKWRAFERRNRAQTRWEMEIEQWA